MKMQKYIRIFLSLILVISNLSVAFSMHLCQGQIKQIKLHHVDNKVCKIQKPSSCCLKKQEAKHCEIPSPKQEDKDLNNCCEDLAYADDLQLQQVVKIQKVSPFFFHQFPLIQYYEFPEIDAKITSKQILDFYVESNAPPIYKLNQQLIFYEA